MWCSEARSMLPANTPNTHLALRTCCGQSELRAQAAALGTSATRPPKMPRKLGLPIGHNGNEANCHATSCCSALPNSSPRRDNIARCMPAWACAYVRERGGSMVRNLWWHVKPTHWTNTCQAHCRSGIQWMAFHNFSLLLRCGRRTQRSRMPPCRPES